MKDWLKKKFTSQQNVLQKITWKKHLYDNTWKNPFFRDISEPALILINSNKTYFKTTLNKHTF